MNKTLLSSPLFRCAHCRAALSDCPEFEYEDWIVRCFACGAKNVIVIGVAGPAGCILSVIGWRE